MDNPNSIIVYSTSWCPDCYRAKYIMNKAGVEFVEIDIDQDAGAAERVIELNSGNRSVPTILFPDGSIMTEPSTAELRAKLESLN